MPHGIHKSTVGALACSLVGLLASIVAMEDYPSRILSTVALGLVWSLTFTTLNSTAQITVAVLNVVTAFYLGYMVYAELNAQHELCHNGEPKVDLGVRLLENVTVIPLDITTTTTNSTEEPTNVDYWTSEFCRLVPRDVMSGVMATVCYLLTALCVVQIPSPEGYGQGQTISFDADPVVAESEMT